MHIRSKAVRLAVVLLLLSAVGPTAAQGREESGAGGSIDLTVHTHSSEFGSPSGEDTLFETTPLDIPVTEGDRYSYSSIPCSKPARFNDKALDFTPDYPGIDDPAPVRHFIEGKVEQKTGNSGTLEGDLTTILCVSGEESEDRIFFTYEGRFTKVSDNELRVTGTFEIVGGSGTFADMTGDGTFKGSLTCLAGTLENHDADSCADLGAFADAVFDLTGSYEDPTV